MGEQDVDPKTAPRELRRFIRRLLTDLRALEKMITEDMIESGVRRIGAEQEIFLVDSAWRPTPIAMELLARTSDPHFTNEIALFNFEINVDPLKFGGDCLSQMERELNAMLAQARELARSCDGDIAMVGILPTLLKSDLEMINMTPKPRYMALNDAMNALRGGAYEFKLRGADELSIKHEQWMFEACCTSFQVHYQVSAKEFANLYNVAQVATAPVLAAATNSPLLFGRRLWRETRIPLFEQSNDTRNASYHLRERSPRVSFGNRWVKESVIELFEEDIARFRVLISAECPEDSFDMLRRGETPQLKALKLFNGTVWRWNRACYGVTGGQPHLRIEARAFPSGPTVLDEIANMAFFFGLMSGVSAEHRRVASEMSFDDVKANFLSASRLGLDAQFTWFDRELTPAKKLICDRLIPLAREGLEREGIYPAEIDRYMTVIEERVRSGQTGSQWLLSSMSEMSKDGTKDEVLASLTAELVKNQQEGLPVHTWPLARLNEGCMSKPNYLRVEEFMTTDLFTVHEDEPVELVVNLMDWRHVRHIPVEDEQGRLVGLISCFEVLRQLERNMIEGEKEPMAIASIMNREPLTVRPDTLTLDAILFMRRQKVDCLPVVENGRLVGIVTERDFINLAAHLLEQKLQEN